MGHQANYSLDFYQLNDVFYSRVNTYQPAKKAEAPTVKEEGSKKHSSFLPFFTRRRQSSSSHKDVSCSTSEYLPSTRSSISS